MAYASPRAWLIVALMLAGCVSTGAPSNGLVYPAVRDAYLPLGSWTLRDGDLQIGHAAAVVVAPGIAVTNAHNANLLPRDVVLAQSDYDLLFFRTDRMAPVPTARPTAGARVTAYGQGGRGELRETQGAVVSVDDPVMPRCTGCRTQPAFSFDAGAGVGFSGGPVVEEETGRVLGIVFGFCDGTGGCGRRRMFAYDMALVESEMRRLLPLKTP